MLTLFHSPASRSSRIIGLLHAMQALDKVDIRLVSIPRQDGTGQRDPANPHPEGKVPLLVHDGVEIWETGAIMVYLTDLFPESSLGVPIGDADRGRFLSWMVWYGAVLEPALILDAAGATHPWMTASIRGRAEALARLHGALISAPWLMGARYTVADMLCASAFLWNGDPLPDQPVVREWTARCASQPWAGAVDAYDGTLMATLSAGT